MSDTLNSPFKSGLPDMPKPIPGKTMGPELSNYKPEANIPSGEQIMGTPVPGKISSPYDCGQQSGRQIGGPKNP